MSESLIQTKLNIRIVNMQNIKYIPGKQKVLGATGVAAGPHTAASVNPQTLLLTGQFITLLVSIHYMEYTQCKIVKNNECPHLPLVN